MPRATTTGSVDCARVTAARESLPTPEFAKRCRRVASVQRHGKNVTAEPIAPVDLFSSQKSETCSVLATLGGLLIKIQGLTAL